MLGHLPSLEIWCIVVPALMFLGFLLHAFRGRSRMEFRTQILEVLAAGVRQRLPLAPLLEHAANGLSPYRSRIVYNIAAALREGAPLDEALAIEAAPFFPPPVIQAIRTGAGTARLATMLDLLAADVDRTLSARHRLAMALLYPALVGGLLVFVAWFWLANGFHSMLDAIHSPPPTTSTWAMPLALGLWSALTLLLLLHAAAGRHRYGSNLAGRMLALLLPPVRRARHLVSGERLLRGLSLLLQAGMPLATALRSCATTLGDASAEQKTQDAAWLVESGAPAHEALERAPIPAFAAIRAAAALRADRETAAARLRTLASECATRSQAAYDRLVSLVNPMALFLVGLAVAGLFHQLILIHGLCMESVKPW